MRAHGSSFRFVLCLAVVISLASFVEAAKKDWQSDLHNWTASHLSDTKCTVRYTTGIYRPDLGSQPAWGFMTEKMFQWFSTEGEKLAPAICPVTRATLDQAQYRILLSVSPMKTTSQTTHGYETKTTTEPFQANVTSSDGSSATVQGSQSSTVVVPTETTISRSSQALYMYTYRVSNGNLELLSTDNVVFSRVAASGSGTNATGAELGAGIGNLIRASKDRHRADKLYEEALRSILADATHPPVVSASPAIVPPPPAVQQIRQPSAADVATLLALAEGGSAESQFELGVTYATGQGNVKDESEAIRWFRKAAEQGYSDAQYGLGLMYGTGHGVPKDDAEAYFWLNLGATNLGDEARATRDKEGQMLTPEMRIEVQRRCSEWVKAHSEKPNDR